MNVKERFLDYISYSTQSEPDLEQVPSTDRQWNLAKHLEEECRALGLSNVRLSEHCYVYAELPATEGYENIAPIGFIAHMDTATEISGENVNAQLHENYDGKDVVLGTSGKILDTKNFPHLPSLAGQTLITTDGTTLLGADDKAGIAEIMTMVETVIEEKIPHGKICIAFTPDEEVGNGPAFFDIEGFGAEYAFTVDGGDPSEVCYETFQAAQATIEITGYSIHPGSAKNKMINALLVGYEFNSMLPEGETPRDTEDREGFYHMTSMEGTETETKLVYIIRDFAMGDFLARKHTMEHIAKLLNAKYGEGTVKLTIRDQYPNMYEFVKDKMEIIEEANAAIRACGLTPVSSVIRGGTDGATLSAKGLPCPNLGTGGFAFHGPYEHITVEGLEICTRILLEIIRKHAS